MDVSARTSILGASPTFASLPQRERRVLAEMMTAERYAAGATVCEAGEPAGRVFVVASGALAVMLPGRVDPVRTLGIGDVVGEYGMLAGFVRTASVRAQEDSLLLGVDPEPFLAFLLQFPEAMLVLFRQAVQRLVSAERLA